MCQALFSVARYMGHIETRSPGTQAEGSTGSGRDAGSLVPYYSLEWGCSSIASHVQGELGADVCLLAGGWEHSDPAGHTPTHCLSVPQPLTASLQHADGRRQQRTKVL